MAGAGVGLCIVCGRSDVAVSSDICADCHMAEFWASLERRALAAGDAVDLLRGGQRLWFKGLRVARDFDGSWDGVVWLFFPHSDVPVSYRRFNVLRLVA